MQKNINMSRIFRVFYILFNFNPIYGVIVLYLMFIKNLNYFEISLFFSLYTISIVISEIPTGIVADRISRKISVLSGKFIELILFVTLPFLNGFYWISGWAILWGISESLKSGAVSAWVYDNLKYKGAEKAYSKVLSHLKTLGTVSSLSALLVGGAVSLINYNYTIVISIIFMFASCVMGLLSPEHPYKRVIRNYLLHSKDAVKLILRTNLRGLIILSLIVESIFTVWSTFSQKYLYMILPNTIFVTGVLALGIIMKIFGYNIPGKDKMYNYLPFLIALLLILIGSVPILLPKIYSIILVLLAISFLYVFISLFEIVWNVKFQQNVSSELRASAMSIYSTIATLCISLTVTSVGALADIVGLYRALLIGGFFLLTSIYFLHVLKNNKKTI